MAYFTGYFFLLNLSKNPRAVLIIVGTGLMSKFRSEVDYKAYFVISEVYFVNKST
jgi:hypothetical protein